MKKLPLFFVITLLSISANAQYLQSVPSNKGNKIASIGTITSIPCDGFLDPSKIDTSVIIYSNPKGANEYNEHESNNTASKIISNQGSQRYSESNGVTQQVPPTILSSFMSNQMTQNYPSDNSLAISNAGQIVSADNDRIKFFTSTGVLLNSYTYPNFFSTTNTNWADPRLIYDSGSDRFIFVIQSGAFCSTCSFIKVLFSKTNDPNTGGWWVYTFNDYISSNYWFDYPSICVSTTDFFIGGSLLNASGNLQESVIYQGNKNQGYSGVALSSYPWRNVTTSGSAINGTYTALNVTPISYGQQGTYGPGIYLLAMEENPSTFFNNVYLFTIDNSLFNSPSIFRTDIPVASYSRQTVASQLGTGYTLDGGFCSIKSGFYLNNKIHFIYDANDVNGNNVVMYNRLDVTNSTITTAFAGTSGTSFSYGCVASIGTSTSDASVVVGFVKSDANTYPELRFKYYDNAMSTVASTLVRAGNFYVYLNNTNLSNGGQRWGDYITIQRRFNTSTYPTVWLHGAYGDLYWSSYIAEIGYQSPTGINENIDNHFSIYPNPSNGDFTITQTDLIKDFEIRILDVLGRKIFEKKSSEINTTINLRDVQDGVYIVQIREGDNTYSRKIIIRK